MRQRSIWATTVIGLGLISTGAANGQASKGVINEPGKQWQVTYHKSNSNPKHGAMAIRLHVKEGNGNKISGTLTLFKSVSGSQYSGKLTVELKGQIKSNPGGGHDRKRQDFELLEGTYTDSAGEHRVEVKGFHYTGRSKGQGPNPRRDDQIVIRIIDKIKAVTAPVGQKAAAVSVEKEPCDEQPPDEDVLTEENVPPPEDNPPDPDYDAEG